MDSRVKQIVMAIAALLLSAAAWFFGTGLHPHWALMWLAPLPVLLLAPRATRKTGFLAAFFAFAIGGLNCWSYYRHIVSVPIGLALTAVLVPALFFGLIVLLHRRFVLRGQLLRAAFVLPILWTAFEYLVEFHSPNGTWGNLGYSQIDLLPLIQVASVTGIWAISFVVLLFAGTISALAAPSGRKLRVAVTVGVIYAAVFGYGGYRLTTAPTVLSVRTGLLALDASPDLPSGQQTVARVQAYADQIPAVAAQGAQIIVLPEEIGEIQGDDLDRANAILEQAARQSHVTILAGFRVLPNRNQARLYAVDGTLEATYDKHHLLAAFEGNLLPGTRRTLVGRQSGLWGLEICKDMDFPRLSREYGGDRAGLMLVPAWDFVVDGWLHSRMAILRGVESGFSLARTARKGKLTLTDSRGRVIAEQPSAARAGNATAPFSALVADVPVSHQPTLYAQAGDWFAWLDLLLAAVLLASAVRAGRRAARKIPAQVANAQA